MPLFTIADMLREAPSASAEFRTAVDYFAAMIDTSPDDERKAVFKGCCEILRNRFRSGEDLARLANHLTDCGVVWLYSDEIRIDPDSITDGPMAKVNTFAALHMRRCEKCRFLFTVEELTRAVKDFNHRPDKADPPPAAN